MFSILYSRVDELTPDDRLVLLPFLENVVEQFEDYPSLRNFLKPIQLFIDEELKPVHDYYSKLAQFSQSENDNGIPEEDAIKEDVAPEDDLFNLSLRKVS